MRELSIDAAGSGTPLPKFWQALGCDHLYQDTRSGAAEHLFERIGETGAIRYLRNHHALSDEMADFAPLGERETERIPMGGGIYHEDDAGRAVYDFSIMDQVYDRWVAAGIRPIVEMDRVPALLRAPSGPVPVNDFARWTALISAFTEHLLRFRRRREGTWLRTRGMDARRDGNRRARHPYHQGRKPAGGPDPRPLALPDAARPARAHPGVPVHPHVRDHHRLQGIQRVLGYWRSPWVGLKHFIRVFEDDHFWVAFLNTLKFGISSLVFGFPAPILFALLLNELRHRIYKGTVQTFLYIPNFISMVVIAGIIIDLLDPNSGLVNGLIVAVGGQPIYFMVERAVVPAHLHRLRDLADDRLRHDHLPGGDVRHRPATLRGGHHRRRQPGAARLARHRARHPARPSPSS